MKNEKEIAKSNLEMLKSYAKEFIHHGMELQKVLKKETEIDAWVVAKAERATTDLSDITHYLDGKSEYAEGGRAKKTKNDYSEEEYNKKVGKTYYYVLDVDEDEDEDDEFNYEKYEFDNLKDAVEAHESSRLNDYEPIQWTTYFETNEAPFVFESGIMTSEGVKKPQWRKGKWVHTNDKGEEVLSKSMVSYAKGGKLDKKATYVPKRDIAEVEVEKNGKTKFVDGADLLDGVYVKKSKFAIGGKVGINSLEGSDRNNFIFALGYSEDREVNHSGTFEAFEKDFTKKVNEYFNSKVLKAVYDELNKKNSIYKSKNSYARGGISTNSKQVRDAVKKHILESVYDENEKEFKNFDDASKYLAEEFRRVADHRNNQIKFPNNQDRFTDYLKGIPFNFEYTDEGLEKFLNGLGINPSNKIYTGDQMWKLYGAIIWKEIYPKYTKYAKGGKINRSDSGQLNGMYLDSLSEEKKKEILTTIAKHYDISLQEANEEVRDSEAELLFEYTASNEKLSLRIYNEIKNMITTYAKGGEINPQLYDVFVRDDYDSKWRKFNNNELTSEQADELYSKLKQSGNYSDIAKEVANSGFAERFNDDEDDFYEVYDDETGKSLMIQAIDQNDANSISERIDFEAFEDGDELEYGWEDRFAKGGDVTGQYSVVLEAGDIKNSSFLSYLKRNGIKHKILSSQYGTAEVEFIGSKEALTKMIDKFWSDIEKEEMEEMYSSIKKYAKGGRVKVGVFDENQLKNKEDKKAVEKAQKETGLNYVDSNIIKKGGKMFLEVYLIPNEEYYNSNKFAKGGDVKMQMDYRLTNKDEHNVEAMWLELSKDKSKTRGEIIDAISDKLKINWFEISSWIERNYKTYAQGGEVSTYKKANWRFW